MTSSLALRAWQVAALRTYFERNPQDFLAVATPGAGKTTFALTVARELMSRRVIERITIVTPTEHLTKQWATAAAEHGIAIEPNPANGVPGKDFLLVLQKARRENLSVTIWMSLQKLF